MGAGPPPPVGLRTLCILCSRVFLVRGALTVETAAACSVLLCKLINVVVNDDKLQIDRRAINKKKKLHALHKVRAVSRRTRTPKRAPLLLLLLPSLRAILRMRVTPKVRLISHRLIHDRWRTTTWRSTRRSTSAAASSTSGRATSWRAGSTWSARRAYSLY